MPCAIHWSRLPFGVWHGLVLTPQMSQRWPEGQQYYAAVSGVKKERKQSMF